MMTALHHAMTDVRLTALAMAHWVRQHGLRISETAMNLLADHHAPIGIPMMTAGSADVALNVIPPMRKITPTMITRSLLYNQVQSLLGVPTDQIQRTLTLLHDVCLWVVLLADDT